MRPRRVLATSIAVGGGVIVALAAAEAALAVSAPAPGQMAPVPIGPVHLKPVTTTPHLLPDASPAQQVRQLVQCRGTMFAVGSFATIEQGKRRYSRENVVSFSASSPYTVSSWAPKISYPYQCAAVEPFYIRGGVGAE
jgi:hypothetical protein